MTASAANAASASSCWRRSTNASRSEKSENDPAPSSIGKIHAPCRRSTRDRPTRQHGLRLRLRVGVDASRLGEAAPWSARVAAWPGRTARRGATGARSGSGLGLCALDVRPARGGGAELRRRGEGGDDRGGDQDRCKQPEVEPPADRARCRGPRRARVWEVCLPALLSRDRSAFAGTVLHLPHVRRPTASDSPRKSGNEYTWGGRGCHFVLVDGDPPSWNGIDGRPVRPTSGGTPWRRRPPRRRRW